MRIGRLIKQRVKKKYSAGPLMLELEPRVLLSADLPGGLAGDDALHDSVLPTTEPAVLADNEGMSPMDVAASATQTLRLVVPIEKRDTSETESAVTQTHELAIVNLNTPDYEVIVDDLVTDRGDGRQFEVVMLDTDRGGIEQLSALLGERTDLDAVHIISHGDDGSISLGNELLDLDALIANSKSIQGWGDAFTDDGDLLIYGCNLAAGADGRAFIDVLGRLTGTDIAASTDLTGLAALGGDWDLEYRQGVIEVDVAVSAETQSQWGNTLAVTEDLTSFSQSSGAPISVNHTTSGTGRLMMVGVSMNMAGGSETVDTVKWNNTDLTLFDVIQNGQARVELWYMVAPETGNFNVDVTFSSAPDGATVGVTTFNGVDQSTPLGVFDSGQGNSTTGSATISSAAGELVYAVISTDDGSDKDLDTGGQNELFEAFGAEVNGSGISEAGAPSVGVSWTWSGGDVWAVGGVSIKPATGVTATVDPLSTADTTPQLTGTVSDPAATIDVTVDGNNYVATNNGDGTWTLADNTISPALTEGIYDVAVTVTGGSETVRDEFNSVSYMGNDGSASWAGDWIEKDDYGAGPGVGIIDVAGNRLQLRAFDVNQYIHREVDLSSATTATLTFDSDNQLLGADSIRVEVSGNGGGSWTTLKTYTSSNTGVVAESFDISAYIASNTQVRFYVEFDDADQFLYIDNVEIDYNSVGTDSTTDELVIDLTAPVVTVDALLTNDPTPQLTGTVDDPAATISVTVDGNLYAATNNGDGTWTLADNTISPALTEGTYDVAVSATDAAGNTGNDSSSNELVIDLTAPVAADDPVTYSTYVNGLSRLAYWRLDESSGTTVYDETGTNDGTYINGPSLGQGGALADEPAHTAVAFAGTPNNDTGDYIEIADDPSYLIDEGAIQLWFNTSDVTQDAYLFSKDASGTVSGGHVQIGLNAASHVIVRLQDTATSYNVESTTALTANEWHHVVFTFGSGGMQLYVDGQLVDTDAYTGGLGTSSGGTGNIEPIVIGASSATSVSGTGNPTTDHFGGRIDEVAMFGAELTAEQIRELYGAALQNYTIYQDTTLSATAAGGVLATDYDANNNPLTAVLVSGPSNAQSFMLNADGSFDYTPVAGFTGTDTFTYRANDGANNSNLATVTVTVEAVVTANAVWISTDADAVAPGADGLPAGWRQGEALQFGGVDLAFGPTTDGDFSSVIDFDTFALDATDPTALHYVSSAITVGGGANTFDLQRGDVLVSFNQAETILGAYTVSALDETFDPTDLLAFRPDTLGDYTSGTFYLLLDDVVPTNLRGVTLVEQDTTVGDANLTAGSFLLVSEMLPFEDVYLFDPTGVGAGTTTGTTSTLIDGAAINIDSGPIRGLELIEQATSIGGVILDAGTLLFSLRFDDPAVGGNNLATVQQDIFAVTVTKTGVGTTAGVASMFLDGSDVGLDGVGGSENIYGLALVPDNNPPTAANNTVVTLEDTDHVFTVADFNFSDPDGDSLQQVQITSLETVGALQLSGVDVILNQVIAMADITAGNLTFTPVPDANGAGYDSFQFLVHDGTDYSAAANTMTIDVTAVNDAPTAADNTVVTLEDTAYVFTVADFNFSDIDTGDTLQNVQITSLETAGALQLSGVDVVLNQIIAVADIVAGNLTFTPAQDANGVGYDSFGFKVGDGSPATGTQIGSFVAPAVEPDSGLAWDGTNLWLSERGTDTIYELTTAGAIISSFAAPGTAPAGLTFDGTNLWHVDKSTNTIYELTTAGAIVSSFAAPGSDPQGITWDGTNLWIADRTDLTIYEVTTTGTLVSSFAAPGPKPIGLTWDGTNLWVADNTTDLTYEVTTTGTVLSSFTTSGVQGLTFDGTDFWYARNNNNTIYELIGPGTGGYSVSSYTMTVDVTPVSDVPTAADNTVVTLEDTAHVFTVADFNFSDPDTGDTLQYVQITSLETAGALQLSSVDVVLNQVIAVADIIAGNLTFTPAPDANGVGYDSFGFKVSDGTPVATGTVRSTITPPNVSGNSDLAFDGTNLWLSYPGSDTIFELDTAGNVLSSFGTPGPSPAGLTFDGTNLWLVDRSDDEIYEVDTSGNLLSQFDTALFGSGSPRGLTWDGTSLWLADDNDQLIYELDTAGNVLSSFASPDTGAAGITFDGTDFWHADTDTNDMYQLAGPNGTAYSAAAYTMTIDVTPVPDVTVNTLTTNNTSPQLTGTVDDPAATIDVTVDGNLYAAVNNGDGTWTLAAGLISPALTDGTYDVAVSATNGEVGTDSTTNELVIDTTGPTVTPLTTNNPSPPLSGTVDDPAATINVNVDGNNYAAINNGDGTWDLSGGIIAALAENTYEVVVTATDTLGNPGTDGTNLELVIDLTGPSAPVVNALTTNDNTPILSGTFDSADSPGLRVAVNGVTYILGTDPELTNIGDAWTLDLSAIAPLPDATYEVAAIATDAVGNAASDITNNELVIDTTGPTVTVTPLTTNNTTPTVTGTFDSADSAGLSVAVDGVTYVLGTDPELTNVGNAWSLNLSAIPPLADNTYEVTAIATDALSNPTTDSSSNELVIDTTGPSAPVVNALTTSNTTPTLTGTYDAADSAGLSVAVNGVTYVLGTNPELTAISDDWTLDLSAIAPLATGTYPVTAIASDALGNLSIDATTDELVIVFNTAPVAVDDNISVTEDVAHVAVAGVNDLLLNDSDSDGDPLSVDPTPVIGPSQGAVILNADGTFTYVPNANFNGADAFTYRILDGAGGVAQATVLITVDPVDDAPVVTADSYNLTEDSVLASNPANAVLVNDVEVDGEAMLVNTVPVSNPSNGVLILNPDGTFAYTPDANFNGVDGFTYQVADSNGTVSQGNVTITVGAVDDPPVGVADNITADGGIASVLAHSALTVNDANVDGDGLTITNFTQPSNGTVFDNGDGTFTYTPAAGFSGVDSFVYTLADPDGNTSTASVVVTVTPEASTTPGPDPSVPPPDIDPIPGTSPPPDPGIDPTDPEPGSDDPPAEEEALVSGGSPGSQGLNEIAAELALSGPSGGTDLDPDTRRVSSATAKYFYDTLSNLEAVFEFEGFDFQNVDLDHELLWQALDTMKRELSGLGNTTGSDSVFAVQIASAGGIVLSVGYISWILRGGALAATLLSTMPLWRQFDPLPLLAARKRRREKKHSEEDTQRAAKSPYESRSDAEKLFADEQTTVE